MQTEVLRGGGYWYVGDKSPVLEEFRNEMQIYERMSYMAMLRSEAFRDMPAALWRFESAAVTTPQLAKARGYAQNWDEFKKRESACSCSGMSARESPMPLDALPML